MLNKYFRKSALALALAGFAGVVLATITFNPPPGDCTGFVGKGDVQTACGWNNAQLQANAGGSYLQLRLYRHVLRRLHVCDRRGNTR